MWRSWSAVVGAVVLSGSAALLGASAPVAGAALPAAAKSLRTCGTITPSTGIHRRLLTVKLAGPARLVTGRMFKGSITVYLRPRAARSSVRLMSGAPVLPVIARGNQIVGQYEGGVGGVGIEGTVTKKHPFRFPGPYGRADVLLRGCPKHVDPRYPDRSRKLLPPGHYTLYAYIEDDGGKNGYLLSQPFPIVVLPRPASQPMSGWVSGPGRRK